MVITMTQAMVTKLRIAMYHVVDTLDGGVGSYVHLLLNSNARFVEQHIKEEMPLLLRLGDNNVHTSYHMT
jgi:hypothetical protein